MTVDTMWSDVSEWQVPVDDSYPYQVLAVRSNDGTYRDRHFQANYRWACTALDSGRLKCLLIYLVYRPNWRDDLATLQSVIGQPHRRVAFMLDVESWGGQIQGDNSASINDLYRGITDWIGTPASVVGYGNTNDLDRLWPTRPTGLRLIIAAYDSNPNYPGKLAHQFTDGTVGGPLNVPPFGKADVNSADGYDIDAFCAALGTGDDMTPDQDKKLTDMWHVLTDTMTSEVPGSTYSAPPRDFWRNTDRASYVGEQAIHAIATAVAAEHNLSAADVKATIDAELGKTVNVKISVDQPAPTS